MGELDTTIKVLLRLEPRAFARLVLADAEIVDVRQEETVLTASERRLDKVLRIEHASGETSWLHVEVEAVWRSTIPRRVFDWWSRLQQAHRGEKVSSLLIVLKRGERQRRDPTMRFVARTPLGTSVEFRCKVVRAWADLDGDGLLGSNAAGLLPLVPYARGTSREHVATAMERIACVDPPERRAELQAALAIFAGDVFPNEDWLGRIPQEIMMKSKTLEQLRAMGREMGRAEGRAEILASQIRKLFGASSPPALEERLLACSADVLGRISAALVGAPASDALAAELAELLPPPPPADPSR